MLFCGLARKAAALEAESQIINYKNRFWEGSALAAEPREAPQQKQFLFFRLSRKSFSGFLSIECRQVNVVSTFRRSLRHRDILQQQLLTFVCPTFLKSLFNKFSNHHRGGGRTNRVLFFDGKHLKNKSYKCPHGLGTMTRAPAGSAKPTRL